MSDWGQGYQIRLLAWLCLEPHIAQYLPYLKAEYCETSLLQILVPIIKDYWREYKKHPTATVLRAEIDKQPLGLLDEDETQLAEICQLISAGTFSEIDYIKDSFRNFVNNRELLATLADEKTLALIDEGDWTEFLHKIKTAEPSIKQIDSSVEVFNFDVLAPLYNENLLKTNFPMIDNRLKGCYRGESIIFSGSKKSGKSLVMIYIGGQMLRQGYKVLHVTLEMSTARVMSRYFATLADPVDDITVTEILELRRQEHVIKHILNLYDKYHGKFCLVDMPAQSTTVADILHVVEKFEPDFVIVDYINEMRHSNEYKEKHEKVADTYRGLRSIAKSCDVHLLTANQLNRGALHKKVTDASDMAEAYSLSWVADAVINFGKGKDDQRQRQIIMHLSDARNADSGFVERYQIDFEHMNLTYIGEESLHAMPDHVGD